MNKAILMGRLVRDPETRQTQSNEGVTRFTIAVDRKYKKDGDQTADFINCVAFSKTSDFVSKYFHKGNRIAVVGRIQTGNYTNKDGNKVYTTDVICEEVDFCESKKEATETAKQEAPDTEDEGFVNVEDSIDDELPFN